MIYRIIFLLQLLIIASQYFIIVSANKKNSVCGQADIGNVTCGHVNAVTSVDITLYPPAETTYEVTLIWKDSVQDADGYDGYIEKFINYYDNITEAKTFSITVMFSEPDMQTLSVSVRGYNADYTDEYDYTTFTNEVCYETSKPSNDKDKWMVLVNYDSCSESYTETTDVTFMQTISEFDFARNKVLIMNVAYLVLLGVASICIAFLAWKKLEEDRRFQIKLVSRVSLLNEAINSDRNFSIVKGKSAIKDENHSEPSIT